MTHSIYHFFHSLLPKKQLLKSVKKLEQFPFNRSLLSCRNKGVFPDLAIRLNTEREIFTGGEFIELKDSNSYSVSSFNSTIPSRNKKVEEVITGENSIMKQQMKKAGNNIFSLPTRDVFYLIRGKKKQHTKVCLVYGSFFETISVENLISQSFRQVLEEQMAASGEKISDNTKQAIILMLSQQKSFSKVRDVEKSSVKLRFRIMTEVKAEGNILNSKKYPEIKDDTLNFILPCHNDKQEQDVRKKLESVFSKTKLRSFRIFKIKHHLNGYFLVLQTKL